jgi:hypothetical protein
VYDTQGCAQGEPVIKVVECRVRKSLGSHEHRRAQHVLSPQDERGQRLHCDSASSADAAPRAHEPLNVRHTRKHRKLERGEEPAKGPAGREEERLVQQRGGGVADDNAAREGREARAPRHRRRQQRPGHGSIGIGRRSAGPPPYNVPQFHNTTALCVRSHVYASPVLFGRSLITSPPTPIQPAKEEKALRFEPIGGTTKETTGEQNQAPSIRRAGLTTEQATAAEVDASDQKHAQPLDDQNLLLL